MSQRNICKFCHLKLETNVLYNSKTHEHLVKITQELFNGIVNLTKNDYLCIKCQVKLQNSYDFYRFVIDNQQRPFVLTAEEKDIIWNDPDVEVFEPIVEQSHSPKLRQKKTLTISSEEIIFKVFDINCDICSSTEPFNSFQQLVRHYSSLHGKPRIWNCCELNLKKLTELIEHAKEHLNPSICPFCKEKIIRKVIYKKHLKICTSKPERFFECEHCTKKFKIKSKLKIHLHSIHFKSNQTLPNNCAAGANVFLCHTCGKSYAKKFTLQQHINFEHNGEDPTVQCPYCGIMVKARHYGLRSHIKQVHEEVGIVFTCSDCGKIFNKSRTLTKHMTWSHRRGRSHICEICKRGFYTPLHLKEHIAAIHTKKPNYFCHCGAVFKSNGNFYAHKRRVHANEQKN